MALDLETLKQVKFMFDLQSSDMLEISNSIGYKALQNYIEGAEKALLINSVVVPKGTLPIDFIEDWHIKRWNNGLETGASMEEIREDMETASEAIRLNNSIKWLEK